MMRRLGAWMLLRPDERRLALYLGLLFLLLGAGLALGRGSMEALFFKRYGIENLPWMYGVLAPLLAATSLLYATFVDRLPAERLFALLLAMLAVAVGASWFGIRYTGFSGVYPAYFLVYEVASELLLLHASVYLTQNLDTLQSKRLTPLCFAAAQIGMVVGGLGLAALVSVAGASHALLGWLGLSVLCALLLVRWHRTRGISPFYRPGRRGRQSLGASLRQVREGVEFSRRSPLALAANAALFFMVIGYFVLAYAVNRVYTDTFPTADALAAFFGVLTAATSAIAVVAQLFLAGRLLRRFGVPKLNLVFPASTGAAYLALFASFSLPAALLGSFARDAVMPAIRRPVRQLIMSALPDRIQGRARALSVAIVIPVALLVTSGMLLLAQRRAQATEIFLLIGLVATTAYVFCNLWLNRTYVSTIVATLRERLFVMDRDRPALTARDVRALLAELARGIREPSESVAADYARMLVETFPQQAGATILPVLPSASAALRLRLLELLADPRYPITTGLGPTEFALLRGVLPALGNDHERALALRILFSAHDPLVREEVGRCLASADRELAATGIFGAHVYGLVPLLTEAERRWEAMLLSPDHADVLAGLALIARRPGTRLTLHVQGLLDHLAAPVRLAALRSLRYVPVDAIDQLGEGMVRRLSDPEPAVREQALACLSTLAPAARRSHAQAALRDPHPRVRDAAAHVLLETPDGEAVLRHWLFDSAESPRAQQQALRVLLARRPMCEWLARLAERKLQHAIQLYRSADVVARVDGSRPDVGLALLGLALAEQAQETTDLALEALEHMSNEPMLGVIRSALRSGERAHIGRAVEAMSLLDEMPLVRRLAALLEQHAVPHSEAPEPREIRELVHWCLHQDDAWLRQCAARVGAIRDEVLHG